MKMLTEKRYNQILECLKEKSTVTVSELVEFIGASESTIRRDLNSLDKMGKLIKLHGGAATIENDFSLEEHSVEIKKNLNSKEKEEIAKYAASTLRKGDFVYIDAGTTTEKMIDYISETDVTFVTNGFTHAKKLAKRGFRVLITGGQIKVSTEAVVGTDTVEAIRKYNFTKCFMGTNGISLTSGFTTPDIDEASVKSAAIQNSYITYILADHTKFDVVSSVTFASSAKGCIITDILANDKYKEKCVIKEVLK